MQTKRKESGKFTTLNHIARDAGVSISTVSRVIGSKPGISKLIRDRVTGIAQNLGYNQKPRKTSQQRPGSRRWAFIASTYAMEHIRNGNPFYCIFFAALQELLATSNMNLIMVPVENDATVPDVLQRLAREKVRGGVSTVLPDKLLRPLASEFPLVLYNTVDHNSPVDMVLLNAEHAANAQIMHLKSLGHRRIACFRNYPALHQPNDLAYWREFTRVCLIENLIHEPYFKHKVHFGKDEHAQAAESAIASWFEMDRPPTAIVTHDFYAHLLIHALSKRNLKVPQDVSIFGFNDTQPIVNPEFSLSSYRPNYTEMARQVLSLLNDRLSQPKISPRTLLVSGELMLRNSTGPATT